MGSKVIHVSDDLHALVREYCDQNNHHMSEWVKKVLQQEIQREAEEEPVEKLEEKPIVRKETVTRSPVEKKEIINLTGESANDRPKPWEQRPFWERGD